MEHQTLTALAVERFQKRDARYEVADAKVRGLRLVVQPSGAKSWCVRYSRHNRDRKFTLGDFPTLKLDEARKRAGAALAVVASGRDPGEERKKARREEERERLSAITVEAAFDRYLAEYVKIATAESSAAQTEWLFRKLIVPAVGRLTVADVTPGECHAIWAKQRARGRNANAFQVFTALRRFFNWLRAELILTKPSPLEGLTPPEGSKARERVLTDHELRLVWLAADAADYPFGPLVKLLILTLARRSEAAEMTRYELDLDGASWTIPAERTKNGCEHVVPLAPLALEILQRLHNHVDSDGGFILTTDGQHAASNFSKRKRSLDAIVTKLNDGKPLPRWTLHDLRRTGATGMAELGVAPHIVEACINHVSGSKSGVAGVYNRAKYAEPKADAFKLWAAHVKSLTDPRRTEGV